MVRGQRKPACSRPGEHALPKPDSQPGKRRASFRLAVGEYLRQIQNFCNVLCILLPSLCGWCVALLGLILYQCSTWNTQEQPCRSPSMGTVLLQACRLRMFHVEHQRSPVIPHNGNQHHSDMENQSFIFLTQLMVFDAQE